MGLTKTRNKNILINILRNIQPDIKNPKWLLCPRCGSEWNRLGQTGCCIDCEAKGIAVFSLSA